MSTGELRPIEDVKCTEHVFTAEGRIGQVRNVMARPYKGQIINVCLHGHNLIRCTPEHPFLTERGYVAAKNLRESDYVAIPKVVGAGTSYILTQDHVPTRSRAVNEHRTLRNNAPLGRTITMRQIAKLPDVIHCTPEFGEIIGLFLAEGNVDKQKIVWTFNANEETTLAARLVSLLKSALGIDASMKTTSKRSTCKVTAYGTLWARVFESLCSTGSGSKKLHKDLCGGGREFLKAIYDGWIAGDGCRSVKRKNVTGVTVSRNLAVQMFQIANAIGSCPAIRRSETHPSGNVKSRLPRYDLTTCESGDDSYRMKSSESHSWRKVRMLITDEYDGYVHNLHVHGDESYIADGLGVHNCVGNMAAAACEYLQSRAVGRDKVISISAMSMYKQIGSSPNSGANVGDSMKRAIDTGFLPLDTDENKQRFKHTMSHTGFRQSWPSGWKDTAKLFANCEAFVCESYAEAFSAGLKGMCIGVGRAGHSILYLDPIWDDSAWFWDYVNSWGQWGFGKGQFEYGFGRDSSRYWKSALDWCVAWEAADTAGFEWILQTAA